MFCDSEIILYFFIRHQNLRACLKNHSRNLYAPLCGIFCPNSVAVARYGALIWTKFPTNCDAHLAESLFQTRFSSRGDLIPKIIFVIYMPPCGRFHLNSGIVVWYEKIVNTWTVWVYVIISQTLVLKFTSRYILCHLHTQGEEEA